MMRIVKQDFDEIIDRLSPLDASWMDDTAEAIMARIRGLQEKTEYTRKDIEDGS